VRTHDLNVLSGIVRWYAGIVQESDSDPVLWGLTMPEWLGRLLGVVGSACLVWTALLIVPPAPAAQAAVTFSDATSFAMGTQPTSVAVADFDDDGNVDVVTANVGSDNVSILLGTGTGSFGPLHASTLDTRGPRHHVGHRDADAEEVEGLSC
jgi:hypothetical protein